MPICPIRGQPQPDCYTLLMSQIHPPQFAVIYRWRLAAGKEDQFRAAWERVTVALLAHRGALGSRLHRTDDGTWLAYAQWPDRDSWQRSRDAEPIDPESLEQMRDAVEESFEPILLQPVADHLKR